MATFDGLVLRRCLYDRDEILHAGFYWHELAHRINGMSVSCLRSEVNLAESIFFGTTMSCFFMISQFIRWIAQRLSGEPQLLYEFPWR